MHGSGLTHIVWSLHEQFLATKGYSILSVDLPGHGNSEGPAIKSIEEISEWIKKSMEELKIKEISFIGHSWDNDIRIILFVIMNRNYQLNNELIRRLKIQIRVNASPRHVPSKILNVKDIPRTKNGKIVELAVKNIIEGNEVKNKEALANPEILDEFRNLNELKY